MRVINFNVVDLPTQTDSPIGAIYTPCMYVCMEVSIPTASGGADDGHILTLVYFEGYVAQDGPALRGAARVGAVAERDVSKLQRRGPRHPSEIIDVCL